MGYIYYICLTEGEAAPWTWLEGPLLLLETEHNKSVGPKFVCFNAGQPEQLPFFLASFRACPSLCGLVLRRKGLSR